MNWNRECFNQAGQPKIRYDTRADARKVLHAVGPLHIYRCGHCGWFHIGHTPSPRAIRQIHQRRRRTQEAK